MFVGDQVLSALSVKVTKMLGGGGGDQFERDIGGRDEKEKKRGQVWSIQSQALGQAAGAVPITHSCAFTGLADPLNKVALGRWKE